MTAIAISDEVQAILKRRHLEASYFRPVKGVGDSETLRLSALAEALHQSLLKQDKRDQKPVELDLIPGEPARLWVGLSTSVVMQPDYRTFRVEQLATEGTTILLESKELSAVSAFIAAFLNSDAQPAPGHSVRAAEMTEQAQKSNSALQATIFAWLCGLVAGAALVLISLKMLK